MGQLNFKKPFEFTVSVKYFTAPRPDLETRIWMFLHIFNTQELI